MNKTLCKQTLTKTTIFSLIALMVLSSFVGLVSFTPTAYAQPSGIQRVQGPTNPPLGFSQDANKITLTTSSSIIEFYTGTAGYNKVSAPNGTVLIYDERVAVEYYKPQGQGSWQQRGTPRSVNFTKINDFVYDVNRYYDDFAGTTYRVQYTVTNGGVKFTLHLTAGQTDMYRVAWSPSGITQTTHVGRQNSVVFGEGVGAVTFDWLDVYQNFGNITVSSVSTHAQGRKMDVYFTIGTVNAGAKIILDPITRVTGNNRAASTSSSFSVFGGTTPVNGNKLVLTVGVLSTSTLVTVSSVTQSGVVWNKILSNTNGFLCGELWVGTVNSATTNQIVITLSSTPEVVAIANVCEYSGLAVSGTVDKTAINSGTGDGTNILQATTGTTATTSMADELWIGLISVKTSGSVGSPLNGFTLLDGAPTINLATGYLEKIVSSVGAASSGVSFVGYEWVGCIVTFKTPDDNAPTYSGLTVSTTKAGFSCNFGATFSDGAALPSNGRYQFGTNNSGSWVWDSAVNFTSTPQTVSVTKTLNSQVGAKVSYQWNFTDNAGNSNTTGVQTFTLTDGDAPTFGVVTGNTTSAGAVVSYSCAVSDNVAVSGYIASWNNSGSWVNGTWASGGSGVLVGTHGSVVGATVSVRFFANDTANNWGASSIYSFVLTDANVPTFGVIAANTTLAGQGVTISCTVSDNVAVDKVIFSWTNTGSWVNQTAVQGSGVSYDASFVGTWGSTVGQLVSVRVYANDTSGNWAVSNIELFTLTGLSISASAGSNGVVSPSGVTIFPYGASQGYTVTANSGFKVLDVLVDGVSVGAVANYTFTSIAANRTISATFTAAYSVVLSISGNPLVGSPATIGVAVSKGGASYFGYAINATKDGVVCAENVNQQFAVVEETPLSRMFAVQSLVDTETGQAVTEFSASPLIVTWVSSSGGGGGGGGGVIYYPTPSPTETPVAPTPTPVPSAIPIIPTPQEQGFSPVLGLVIIVGVIAVAVAFAEFRQKHKKPKIGSSGGGMPKYKLPMPNW